MLFIYAEAFFLNRVAPLSYALVVNSPDSRNGQGRILVLEPDDALRETIVQALTEAAGGSDVEVVGSVAEAQALVSSNRPDLFVLDMDSAHDLNEDFLLDLRTSHPDARAIILTGVHLMAQRAQAADIGAIHFLEKPFPHADFVDLVQALLRAGGQKGQERFQGTLSDLHLSDIIQLKCMSGATSALEFTGPNEGKARVYFENGQVRHAVSPGKKGIDAFNEIVSWKGGKISEVHEAAAPLRTIDLDWQFLLMEAVRKMDEQSSRAKAQESSGPAHRYRILVIDDSLMLLGFVQEILAEANYDVVTGATAEEGLRAAREQRPDLILLDYILPDLRGDEVSRVLSEEAQTKHIPILFMSGFGADLETKEKAPNVFGILNKPFTSDLLLKSVESRLPKAEGAGETRMEEEREEAPSYQDVIGPEGNSAAAPPNVFPEPAPAIPAAAETNSPSPNLDAIVFVGDTSFFALARALRVIGEKKATGALRCFSNKPEVELFARDGHLLLATTRATEFYCSDAPVALTNLDQGRVDAARAEQTRSGCPLFLVLEKDGLILHEPAMQLVEHYGQKLFAELWACPWVRFVFESRSELPQSVEEVGNGDQVDHWALAALRFLQTTEPGGAAKCPPEWIPAYTRDGFERVQKLKLTTAEAQFASQFDGNRSLAQIARNLRLDLKFARLTLSRFLALEIIECWPPRPDEEPQRGGFLRRFSRH